MIHHYAYLSNGAIGEFCNFLMNLTCEYTSVIENVQAVPIHAGSYQPHQLYYINRKLGELKHRYRGF